MWKFWAVVILIEAIVCFGVPFVASWMAKKLWGPRQKSEYSGIESPVRQIKPADIEGEVFVQYCSLQSYEMCRDGQVEEKNVQAPSEGFANAGGYWV